MKNILLIFLVLNTLLVFAQNELENQRIQFECTAITPGEYIINNKKDYKSQIKLHKRLVECDKYSLPEIDFSKYTLIGFVYLVKGCKEPEYTYNIKNINNKIIVTINITTHGYCKRANRVVTWFLIPKLSKNKDVSFNKLIKEQ